MLGQSGYFESAKPWMLPGSKNYRSAGQETIKAAEAYNAPGRFTAFIGYEWTVNTGGNNFHRNVVFRGTAQRRVSSNPTPRSRRSATTTPRTSGSGWR